MEKNFIFIHDANAPHFTLQSMSLRGRDRFIPMAHKVVWMKE